MENIFTQTPADRRVDACALLEVLKMAVEDDSGAPRELSRDRAAGLCRLCEIICCLIADD